MFTSFKHLLFRQYRKSETKNHELNFLFWECTQRCNLNCLHCGSDCTKDSKIKDMPAQDFLKALDNIKKESPNKKLVICITGGEPLLRKDLEEVGKEIKNRGFFWGIVTNGLAFSKERFYSLLKAGMNSLSFSIDGFETEHNHLRQNKNSYQKVIEGIKIINEFQNKYSDFFVYDVITCVYKDNLKILPELRDFLIDLGVKNWRIFSIFPEGRARENDLSLNKEEYKELMEFIASTKKYKKNGKAINLNYACEGYLGKYELKTRNNFFFCRGGINIASIMSDGSVTACLSVRGKDFIQGNIYEENFMDIWNKKFQIMRDRTWAKKGKCKKCKKWKFCLGNGLHLHHDLNQEVSHCNYELLK